MKAGPCKAFLLLFLGAALAACGGDGSSSPPPGPDQMAPSIPPFLSVKGISSSENSLVWGPSSDNVGVANYNIYRDGVLIGTSGTESFADNNIAAGTEYCYSVSAADAAGNESGQTASECVFSFMELATAQALIAQAYQDQLGVSVPLPAVVPTGASNRALWSDWTSTAYIGNFLYRVYLYADGSIEAAVLSGRRPQGEFRVWVVAIDYPSTDIEDVIDNLWIDAQSRINQLHADFATQNGLQAQLVTFNNTNILATTADVPDPTSRADVVAFLATQGVSESDFDLLVSLNLDAANPAGGFAIPGGDFVHMGYFFEMSNDPVALGEAALTRLANATYNHEVGHVWGWEHEWATCSDVVGPPYECAGFITNPALLGWRDTDGDNIVEIIDATPYGR